MDVQQKTRVAAFGNGGAMGGAAASRPGCLSKRDISWFAMCSMTGGKCRELGDGHTECAEHATWRHECSRAARLGLSVYTATDSSVGYGLVGGGVNRPSWACRGAGSEALRARRSRDGMTHDGRRREMPPFVSRVPRPRRRRPCDSRLRRGLQRSTGSV